VSNNDKKKILIVGGGEAGRMVASEIRGHPELNAHVVGFLDDKDELQGKLIDGISVLGRTRDLEEITKNYSIDEIIIAVPTAPGSFVRGMVKRCRQVGVPFKIVPGVMEIIKGDVHIEQIREVRVEDLLGRETVDFDLESIRNVLSGKRILITGAGGSIGSELSRQLANMKPEELIILGRGENRIFDIENEIRARFPDCNINVVIADLRDRDRISRVISKTKPQIIYHTAAHKHVHYMEREPEEAVINNIEATVNLIEASEKHDVERFVFISTDKAANPIGVMGATKRVMELYIRKRDGRSDCRYVIVRFGNVIGSTGSVVPLFLKQISMGGPVTVSDPRATRYFMTVKEASLLVIRASVIGEGGETFILDMGEAINIMELARDLIILSGHEPDSEIPIVVTGLREGEKLHEELVAGDEVLEPIEGEKIFHAIPQDPVPEGLEETVGELIISARRGQRERILILLGQLCPHFRERFSGN